jgi:hypothetical protein
MSSLSALDGRTVLGRAIVHTFIIAAGMTVISNISLAQLPGTQLVSRLLPSSASAEGIGSPLLDGMLEPEVMTPTVMSIESSSRAISSTPAMIAVARPAAPGLDSNGCPIKALSPVDLHDGGLPNAPSAYVPMSSHCKWKAFLDRAYSPYTFATAAYEAGLAQMSDQWPQYGGGMQGWGKRYGATLADTESRRFIQGYVLSTLLHQDPRYFYSTKTNLVARAWYAATRVIITRGDDGRSEFNASEILGALSTSALQNSYYPQHYRTVDATIGRFTGSLSSDATSAILREFTPDLKRMFHQYCPRNIQRFEARLPIPEEDKP